jgi:hypothetical protein
MRKGEEMSRGGRWFRAGLLTVPLGLTAPAVLTAQHWVEISVAGGLGAPVGEFGDELGDEAGLAQWGLALGVDLAVPIRAVAGLAWASTLEGVTFSVDDGFLSEVSPDLPIGADLGRYWGALLFTGIGYSAPVTPDLSLRGVGQIGAGFFKSPSASFTALGETVELVTNWEAAKGLSVGIGATVGDRFTLDARWFKLINTEITGEITYQGITEELSGEQPISWVQVMVGIRVF